MSRRVVVAAAGAAIAVVVVVLGLGLGWWTGGGGGNGSAPATPLAATAALEPAEVFFGDPVAATVAVTLERGAIDASSVRVEPSFAPYAPTGSPRVTRTSSGRSETLSFAYTLLCVDDGCLPGTRPRSIRFPPATVRALAGAHAVTTRATWSPLAVSSRLDKAALASATPKFVGPSGLPAVKFTIAPGPLTEALTAIAGLLAAVAMLLIVRELARYRTRRRQGAAARRTPLEIALAYAREAAGRPSAADRRKALGFLSEVLDERGDASLAASADAVAWAEEPPEGPQVLALADEVEAELRA
ncbi:MAG TPA: hypothetical protein VGN06_02005 [Gaiellaceae bacterium]